VRWGAKYHGQTTYTLIRNTSNSGLFLSSLPRGFSAVPTLR
jgi:hypothetical protein